LRAQHGLLAIEIEDTAFAITREDVDWVKRFLQRFPPLRHECDERGVPLAELARKTGNDAIMQLFDTQASEAEACHET